MADSDLYERAVALAKSRPSISATNLKNALGCTQAQAQSYIRVMVEDGLLGNAIGALARHPVQGFQPGDDYETAIDLYDPKKSTLRTVDVQVDEVISVEGRESLVQVVKAALELEEKKAEINDGLRVIYAAGKVRGLAPAIMRKVVSLMRKQQVEAWRNTVDVIDLYLQVLGEEIEDIQDAGPVMDGGSFH